eukprot:992772-Prymnesium_polylepis.1
MRKLSAPRRFFERRKRVRTIVRGVRGELVLRVACGVFSLGLGCQLFACARLCVCPTRSRERAVCRAGARYGLESENISTSTIASHNCGCQFNWGVGGEGVLEF